MTILKHFKQFKDSHSARLQGNSIQNKWAISSIKKIKLNLKTARKKNQPNIPLIDKYLNLKILILSNDHIILHIFGVNECKPRC